MIMRKRVEPKISEYDISSFPFFSSLTEDQLELVNSEKICYIYKKGSVLYGEGHRLTGFYCIISGIVKIYQVGVDGKGQILQFSKGGDIVGYRSLLSRERSCTAVSVIEEAVICFVPQKILLNLLEKNSNFSLYLLRLACKELKQSNKFITDIAQKSVRQRVAEMLLMLIRDFGMDSNGMLKIIITRSELANMVGTATESVIRLLSEFKQDGVIMLQGRKIIINNLSLLEKIAR